MALNLAIIGSGIIGLACAQRLALEGCRVTTFDGNRESREASWAAAGMLAPHNEAQEPHAFWQLCYDSLKLWPDFIKKLGGEGQETDFSQEADFHQEGCWIPVFDDAERRQLTEKALRFREVGVDFEWVLAKDLAQRAPELNPQILGAYFVEGGHVDPRCVCKILRNRCRELGVELQYENSVAQIQKNTLVDSHGQARRFDHIVLAAGAWTPHLAQLTGVELLGEPVKGQMLRFSPHPQHRRFKGFVHCEHAYAVQRSDGSTVIGSTMEYCGFDHQNNPDSIAKLLAGARKLLPHLQQCELQETWTGLRPKLGDGSPYFKRVNEHLTVATGHFRNGILLTPITAELVKKMVLG